MAEIDWSDDEAVRDFFADDSDDELEFEGFEPVVINQVLNSAPLDYFTPVNDREIDADREAGWTRRDEPPVMAPFLGESKLLVNMDRREPLDFFKLFVDDDFMEVMVSETNRYAETRLADPNLSAFSRMKKWRPVTLPEMKVFLGLYFAMGLVQKNDVQDYWSVDQIEETPFFGNNMSRDRFLTILSNLHLVNNEDQIERGHLGFDALFKVRPFITKVLSAFSDVYQPEKDISFDEATCPWKGRLRFKVYNPSKPNKFGIKLYQVCEASSGYTLGFDVYTGATECVDYAELVGVSTECTLTTKTVIGLLARCGLLDKGHHIYMDNYYTSPELFDELNLLNTYACGTLRKNRKEVPVAIKEKKLKTGEAIFRRRENLLAVKFHDKRDVHMLSTIHQATMAVLSKQNYVTRQQVMKPTCIVEYTRLMGGVDLSDQLNQYYTCLRKTLKWYKKLFFHLMNLAIVNAYILYRKFSPEGNKLDSHNYRLAVCKALFTEAPDAPKPQPKGRKHKYDDKPARLTERHFPAYIPPVPGAKRKRPARDCQACNPSKRMRNGHKRKQTSYWCPMCKKALCVPDCFHVYHTLSNYRAHLLPGSISESSSDSD